MNEILQPGWDMDIALKNKVIDYLFIRRWTDRFYNLPLINRFLIIIILSITFQNIPAQKLGLVLSGGGAPGIAHIGIIKALEENEIPIDCITGTSIGAIIGGMYAMGMTPQEMIQVIKSEDFKSWTTGETDWKNQYYYSSEDSNPGVFELKFHVDDNFSIDFKSLPLPTNLVSPHQMNFAFVPLSAQANAASKGDFDKLFVPFRCVASDIYNKKSVIFRKGELGDAIRASTTFPFMFKPIEIENQLLFDGGIYNNFPVDIMRSDFAPDYIIGSVVANNPSKPDSKDVVNQLQNMIIHPTDYTLTTSDGLLLNFDLKNFNTFDFSKVDELVKIGYDSTMAHLDEIRANFPRHLSQKELTKQRQIFRSHFPKLVFKHIMVNGVDSLQKEYVKGFFDEKKKTYDLNNFRESYFKLISEDVITEVIPHAIYNSDSVSFDLNLKVESENHLNVLLGGNVSSSNSNQAFIGLYYHSLSNKSQTSNIQAQIGQKYNGLGLGTRIELSSQKKRYLKVDLIFHKFNYTNDNKFTFFTQNEAYGKIHFGFPITMNGRIEIGTGFGTLSDDYNQEEYLQNTAKLNENSLFNLGSLFGNIETNTLNNLMHPTKGFNYSTTIQLIGGEEVFKSAIYPNKNVTGKMDMWLQYRAKLDHYFPLSSHISIGTCAELEVSTRKLLQNYTSTIIQAPAFQPTPYSRIIFNGAYSANQFAAIGIKPIYNITNQLHLRTEAYWFVPYKSIVQNENNVPSYSNPFSTSRFMSETSLVFNFRMASASMFVNYFSSAVSKWNVGVNIGILLFNPKFID